MGGRLRGGKGMKVLMGYVIEFLLLIPIYLCYCLFFDKMNSWVFILIVYVYASSKGYVQGGLREF